MDVNVTGLPRFGTIFTADHRRVFKSFEDMYLPGGRIINGTKSRDPGNSGAIDRLRAGLLMGVITSSGYYAPAVIGVTTGALTNSGTTLNVPAAVATEIVRRIGTTGTFKLTGPPTAAGTVRTLTVTYSAVNTSTGDITITALGVNEVQTLTFGAAATGGTMRLRVPLANGTMVTTDAITWNATDATWLAAINTALDAATGVSGGIVATGAAPDTTLTFTFSGTGYAALPQPTEMISVVTFPTSTTTATTVRTTTGVDGRFVAGSLVGDTDGSHTPRIFLPDGYPIKVTDTDGSTSLNQPFPNMPIAGEIEGAQLLPAWPSDTSLRQWIVDSIAASNTGAKFIWDHAF